MAFLDLEDRQKALELLGDTRIYQRWMDSDVIARLYELAERVEAARSLPEFNWRGDRPMDWLASVTAISRRFVDPADRLLVEAMGLTTVLGRGDVDPEFRARLNARLHDVALALRHDVDGSRVAAEAADKCAWVAGMENDAARLLGGVIEVAKSVPEIGVLGSSSDPPCQCLTHPIGRSRKTSPLRTARSSWFESRHHANTVIA